MLKHHIPTQVIAAVFCFCIAGIFIGIDIQMIKGTLYYEDASWEYITKDLLMIAICSLIAIATITGGIGFLQKRHWAVTLMTVLFILGLAFTIVCALVMFSDFTNNPTGGMLYLFAAIGLPLVGLLFFSSAEIFPWAVKKKDEIHHDIIDHF